MKSSLLFCLMLLAAEAGAQEFGGAPALPAAAAIEQALGATIWANVSVSTAGPASDLTSLFRQGCYKLEVIELVLLSAESRTRLFATWEKRKKGRKLSEIAKDYKIDYDRLYEAALAAEEIVDKEYFPRLHQRRKERRYFE